MELKEVRVKIEVAVRIERIRKRYGVKDSSGRILWI